MLSNYTVAHLQERIAYFTETLNKYPEHSGMIQADLEDVKAMLAEAEAREVVGYDIKDNARVYLAENNYGGKLSLYVEGKPSGWLAEEFNIKGGLETSVCYDGGTNWFGKLRFTVDK